jgi:hypothetical protein
MYFSGAAAFVLTLFVFLSGAAALFLAASPLHCFNQIYYKQIADNFFDQTLL